MSEDSIENALAVLESKKADLTPEQLERLAQLSKAGEDVRDSVENTLKTEVKRELNPEEQAELFSVLEARFQSPPEHYKTNAFICYQLRDIDFSDVKRALEAAPSLMWSLAQMEEAGGEPDIISIESDVFIFADCSKMPPESREKCVYDKEAENGAENFNGNAVDMAESIGVELMSAKILKGAFQEKGIFDMYTRNWIKTPADLRNSGYALVSEFYDDYNFYVDNFPVNKTNTHRRWRGVLRVPR